MSNSKQQTSGIEMPLQHRSVLSRLTDGTSVILRPIVGSDREYFRKGFHALSAESRYHRFFSYSPGLSDAELRYFTEVDQINHVAWVAVATEPSPTPGLAVARFIRIPEQPSVAEFALAVIDAMQERLDRRPSVMRIRRATVEHAFGTLKAWMGATHFKTKTLEKVRTEMSLQVLAYNLKRVIALIGVRPLIAAWTALCPSSRQNAASCGTARTLRIM